MLIVAAIASYMIGNHLDAIVILVVVIINSIMQMTGKNPLPYSETQVYNAISIIADVAISLWAWWKNNSFTSAAIQADEYMNAIKNEESDF